MARRALEESISYAKERMSMGKPIWQYQAIGHKIADMAMELEAARLLVHKSAWAVDYGEPDTMVSSFGKAYAADAAMKDRHGRRAGIWWVWLYGRVSGGEADA
ncbi:MAG: acyl-CoA dehydrogenase family protein [Chloroflexi bacterium]|nr:acyl-CoA dehydrogenase family protein [Chloroflexota bacterium]